MSQRRPISFTGMVQPLGGLWHRFAFVLLLFIAFTVMLVDITAPPEGEVSSTYNLCRKGESSRTR